MAILGTLIDRTTISRAGDAGTTTQGVELTTRAHSLPATNPEAVFINMRSIENVGAAARHPIPFGLGGNASILTIGIAYQASVVSAPAIMYDAIAQVFYSTIR